MGKNPDELQREIAAYRRQLDSRISGLEARVRADVDDVRTTAKDDARHAGAGLRDSLDEIADRTHLSENVEQRPLTMLAVAFGAGILLGTLSPGGIPGLGGAEGNGSKRTQPSRANRYAQQDDDGLFSDLQSAVSGMLGATVQTELRELISEAFGKPRTKSSEPERTARMEYEDRTKTTVSTPNDGFIPEAAPVRSAAGGNGNGR